jgi:phosphoglycerate dehydrogenase-like enzyme
VGPVRVLIPLEVGLPLLGTLAPGVSVQVWDGHGEPPGGGAEVDLWVPPFAPLDYAARLQRLPDLRVVHLLTAGHEHVRPAISGNLTLCNAGRIHDDAVAEWALAALLAVVRCLPAHLQAQAQGTVRQFESDTLIGRTVLLLGHGGIGQAIERRLAGFDVDVIRVASRSRDGVHGPDDLPDLLSRAEVVTLAVPLTAETRGMVDAEFLARLPDGAVIVNAARGAIVDQAALTAELTSGRLRAAVDVASPDPLSPEDPLRGLPNFLYTPHVAAATRLIFPRIFGLIGDQIRRRWSGEALRNVVAGPVCPPPARRSPGAVPAVLGRGGSPR